MTPEEYAARQAVISSAVAQFVLALGKFFIKPLLGIPEWGTLLEVLFPEIRQRRLEAAELAREFYDTERFRHHPESPRNDRLLVDYDFEQFVRDMEPTRKRISLEDAPPDAVGQVALRAVRNVENAGRQQIIRAVINEPDNALNRGWARVATGRETCSWCLMLISRGPVFYEASTAGLDLDDESAARMIAAGEDVSEFMEEWHDGCDCKVIPVYDRRNWVGRDAAARALELWNDATKTAKLTLQLDPDRVHTHGSNKGKPFSLNQETLNVLRAHLRSGDISAADYAAFAA